MTRLVGEENLVEKDLTPCEPSVTGAKNQGVSHYKIVSLWMAIVPIICLFFWLNNSTSDVNEFVQSAFIFSTPLFMISTILVIRKYGMKFFKAMFPPVVLAIPIVIWEYFNELENGCSTWGWGTCPPSPPGYHLPRETMMIYLIFLGICAISQVGKEENKPRSYGFAYAAGFCYLIFIIAHANAVFA